MAVVLTDDEFQTIYLSIYLCRYPEGHFPLSLTVNHLALEICDALPEIDQHREQALQQVMPALVAEYYPEGE